MGKPRFVYMPSNSERQIPGSVYRWCARFLPPREQVTGKVNDLGILERWEGDRGFRWMQRAVIFLEWVPEESVANGW